MKLHDLREEPEPEFVTEEVTDTDLEEEAEDEEYEGQLEEDLTQALRLLDEVLPHLNRYTMGRLIGERRTKLRQETLDLLMADASIFMDQWDLPK